ncbi:O-antigen ligase family protein [Parvibaculum sp.]|uniref:O-antigen ligase family protein n=1 Tax=Parvibaculum sp. TaxID=2024848 RepID=UPI00391AD50B
MNSPAPFLARLSFGGLILLLALAPLPLGSNRPMPAALLACAAGLLLVVQAGAMLQDGRGGMIRMTGLAGPFTLLAAVIVWTLIQMAPMPIAMLAHPIWAEASAALGEELTPRISIDPAATGAASMNLLTYVAVFLLAMAATADQEYAARARRAIAAIGAVYAVYGIANFFIGTGWAPGQYISSHPQSVVATFVNRNSFATFAGLCLLCSFSILLDRVRHILSTSRRFRQKAALVVETLLSEARWTSAATLALIVALFLTASRAGIVSSLIAMFALLAFQTGSGRGKGRSGIFALIALSIAGAGFIAGGDRFAHRIDNSGFWFSEDTLRHEIFVTTLEAIRSVPLTGTGYGTYETAIETYRAGVGAIFDIWQKTHNTYLESAVELGLPAALALHGAILWLAIICFLGFRTRRRGRAFPALGVAATLLVGLHALVDFSLQIPAVALLYAFIMGLAVAQANPGHVRRPKARAASGSTKAAGDGLA